MYSLNLEVGSDLLHPEYQHVHHADILRLLERARISLLEEFGFPLEQLISDGYFLVISQLRCVYQREVRQGSIQATVENPRIDGLAYIVEQKLLNSKGKSCVLAEVEMKFLRREVARAVPGPEGFNTAFLAGVPQGRRI